MTVGFGILPGQVFGAEDLAEVSHRQNLQGVRLGFVVRVSLTAAVTVSRKILMSQSTFVCASKTTYTTEAQFGSCGIDGWQVCDTV